MCYINIRIRCMYMYMYIYIYICICVTDMYVYIYIYRNIHMCSKWINWIQQPPGSSLTPLLLQALIVCSWYSKTRYVVFMWFIGKYMGIIWEL